MGILAVLAKSVNNNLPQWQVAPGFEERVREAFGGATVAKIALKVGENYHTLRNYLKLKRDPPPRLFVAIAELTNHSPYWLLADKGPKLIEEEYSGPLFRLEDRVLSVAEKDLIRVEVFQVLHELLLSAKDLKTADSLLQVVNEKIEKMRT